MPEYLGRPRGRDLLRPARLHCYHGCQVSLEQRLVFHWLTMHARSGGADRTARLWNLPQERCIRVLRGHLDTVLCLQLNFLTVVSGSSDNSVKVSFAEGFGARALSRAESPADVGDSQWTVRDALGGAHWQGKLHPARRRQGDGRLRLVEFARWLTRRC